MRCILCVVGNAKKCWNCCKSVANRGHASVAVLTSVVVRVAEFSSIGIFHHSSEYLSSSYSFSYSSIRYRGGRAVVSPQNGGCDRSSGKVICLNGHSPSLHWAVCCKFQVSVCCSIRDVLLWIQHWCCQRPRDFHQGAALVNKYFLSTFLFFQLFIVESHKSHYGNIIDPNSIFTVITSAFIAGGMIGAMVGGLVADKMGRKRGLIISQVVGLLGGVVMAVSEPLTSWEVLLVGRLVAGLTAGLNTVIWFCYKKCHNSFRCWCLFTYQK